MKNILKRRNIFIFFVLINLPLLLCTFDTLNWSDDYQYINLFSVKAGFSPFLKTLFNITGGNAEGGHYAPVYNLLNLLFTKVSIDPRFFHFMVILAYILTAYVVYLIVKESYGNASMGVLAGTLFSLNYYIAFKSLAWNCFHSHLSNALSTGISLYFLLRYFNTRSNRYILLCAFFLLLSIFNYESGFVCLPVLAVAILWAVIKKKITVKKSLLILVILSLVASLFPLGAYLETKKPLPLSYRFQWSRTAQGYAFNANDLLVKSTGFSAVYNKFIFDRLKQDPKLKEAAAGLIRGGRHFKAGDFPKGSLPVLFVAGILTAAFFIFLFLFILNRAGSQTRMFLAIYCCLFLIYVFVFYRTDIANTLSIFSSIIIADLIFLLFKNGHKAYRAVAVGMLGGYLLVAFWTVFDKFDDCYKKSFFGLSREILCGPNRIYDEMNRKIGHFSRDGVIIFAHDYSSCHGTSGPERIGDMVSPYDFAAYNATVYSRQLLQTDIVKKYKDRSFQEFSDAVCFNPNNRIIRVSGIEDAMRYARDKRYSRGGQDMVYISQDYEVRMLTKRDK